MIVVSVAKEHIYDNYNYNNEIFGCIYQVVTSIMLLFLFVENEIDGDSFLALTDDMIKTLIPPIGPRAKFLAKHKKLVDTLVIVVAMHGIVYIHSYEL